MKKIFTLLAAIVITTGASAQSYTILPNDTVRTEAVTDASGGYQYILFQNDTIGGNVLRLEWEMVSTNFDTSAWEGQVCDYTACKNFWFTGREMDPVPPGAAGLISVHIFPTSTTPSLARLVYRIHEVGISVWDTVVFEFEIVTVGVDDKMGDSRFTLSPNPASEEMNLSASTGILPSGDVQVIDLAGRTVRTFTVSGGVNRSLPVADLQNGVYMVRFSSAEGTFTRKMLIAH